MTQVVLSLICAIFLTLLVGCAQKKELYVLNVGDYMNEELIEKFQWLVLRPFLSSLQACSK